MHKQKSPKWDERYMEDTAAHILFAFAFLTQKKNNNKQKSKNKSSSNWISSSSLECLREKRSIQNKIGELGEKGTATTREATTSAMISK